MAQLPIHTIYHKWDLNNNYKVFSQCDCGIIPLNKKNLFGWHKPANKLISFWFTGLPSVVSATPAYKELMDNANEKLYCSGIEDWVEKIEQVKNMTTAEREILVKKNIVYVRNNYSDEALDLSWYQTFEKITSTEITNL
ncbi:MAG: glycosyltransferase [Ginsengibacter sp.]